MSGTLVLYQFIESIAIAVAMVWAFLLLNATGWAPASASSEEGPGVPPMLRFGLWALVASLLISWITYFGQHLVLFDLNDWFLGGGSSSMLGLVAFLPAPVLTIVLAFWFARRLERATAAAASPWHAPRWVRVMAALWLAFGVSNAVVGALWALSLARLLSGQAVDGLGLRSALAGLALVVGTIAAYRLIRWPVLEDGPGQSNRAAGFLMKLGASGALASGLHWLVSLIAMPLLDGNGLTQSWPYVVEWLEPGSLAAVLALGVAIGFALLLVAPVLQMAARRGIARGNPLLAAFLGLTLFASLLAIPTARIGAALQLGQAEGVGSLTPPGLLSLVMPLVVAAVVSRPR